MMWGMPAAWWLMALAVPMVGLFLYRRQATVLLVSAIDFWIAGPTAAAGPFGWRLRHLVTLLVQLLILSLLVTALADPKGPTGQAGSVYLILDCSATMQTKEGAGTRLTEAVQEAVRLVRSRPRGCRFTIVRAGRFPEILAADEPDLAAVEAVLKAVEPADVDADLDAALATVRELVGARQDHEIWVISDFCEVDVNRLAAEFPRATLRQVGSARSNMGIVGLQVLPEGREISVLIGSNQPAGVAFELTLETPGGQTVRTPGRTAGAVTEVRIPATLQKGQEFKVSLGPADDLPLDNVALGIYPAATALRVRLVSPGNVFLEQALAARPGVVLERVHPDRWNLPDDEAGVTILDRPNLASLEGLTGRFIVFSPVLTADRALQELPVPFWLADHPMTRSIPPDSWGYLRGAPAAAPEGARVLVGADAGPLVYEWPGPSDPTLSAPTRDEPPSKVLVFNFDLAASEMPCLPAFPVVLWDAIEDLAGVAPDDDRAAWPTGSLISTPAAAASSPPILETPWGQSLPMIRLGDRFVWQATERRGVYRVDVGRHGRRLAMNWMSMRSTAVFSPIPVRSAGAGAVRPLEAALRRMSWREWLMAAAGVTAAEWFLFRRRILRMD